jgi:hypothetical protein
MALKKEHFPVPRLSARRILASARWMATLWSDFFWFSLPVIMDRYSIAAARSEKINNLFSWEKAY